jgi:hypothetical protein
MGLRRRRSARAGLLLLALALSSCSSKPAPATTAESQLTAYVSIKELMENMIDPIADYVFDAVGTDVSATGVVETRPVTDDDWAKVRQGAVTLVEGTNLLKMPCPVAPLAATTRDRLNAPELSPE